MEQNTRNNLMDAARTHGRNAALTGLGLLALAGCGRQAAPAPEPVPFVPTELHLTGRESMRVEGNRAVITAPNRTYAAFSADLTNGENFAFTPYGSTTSAPMSAGSPGVDRIAIGYEVDERFGGEKEKIPIGTLTYTAQTLEGPQNRSVELYLAADTDPGRTLENFVDGWTPDFRRELSERLADMGVCYEGELRDDLSANQVLQYFERAAEQATGNKGGAPSKGYSFAPDQLRDTQGFVKTFDFNLPGGRVSTLSDGGYDREAVCAAVPSGFVIAFGEGYPLRTEVLNRLADQGFEGHGLNESYNARAASHLR